MSFRYQYRFMNFKEFQNKKTSKLKEIIKTSSCTWLRTYHKNPSATYDLMLETWKVQMWLPGYLPISTTFKGRFLRNPCLTNSLDFKQSSEQPPTWIWALPKGISGKLKPEKQLNLQKFKYTSPCKVMKIYEKKNKAKTTTQTVNLNEKKWKTETRNKKQCQHCQSAIFAQIKSFLRQIRAILWWYITIITQIFLELIFLVKLRGNSDGLQWIHSVSRKARCSRMKA